MAAYRDDTNPPYDDNLWHPEVRYLEVYHGTFGWQARAVQVYFADRYGYNQGPNAECWYIRETYAKRYDSKRRFRTQYFARLAAKRLVRSLTAIDNAKMVAPEGWSNVEG